MTLHQLCRSFEVKVQLDSKECSGKMADIYRYKIKRLPQDILPEKSTYKVSQKY